MLDITSDIQSLTTFRRRSSDFLKQLKRSKRPVILTVKGKAAAIVQDAEAYQRLLDIAARADAEEGIRQGLADAKAGNVRPAEQFFEEFEARHGIPRSPQRALNGISSCCTKRSRPRIPTLL
jgi:prevent-host-death family protein